MQDWGVSSLTVFLIKNKDTIIDMCSKNTKAIEYQRRQE